MDIVGTKLHGLSVIYVLGREATQVDVEGGEPCLQLDGEAGFLSPGNGVGLWFSLCLAGLWPVDQKG